MPDFINHPPHYQSAAGIECIQAIEAALTPEEFEGYLKGNALKYLWRAGKKGEKSADHQKANWYISRLIAHSEPAPEAKEKDPTLDDIRAYQEYVTFCQESAVEPQPFSHFVSQSISC